MGKNYYLYVYSITGDEVLKLKNKIKCDDRKMNSLTNKLSKYNLFNKIDLFEFDEDFPEKTNEFTVYSLVDRKHLSLKKSVSKDVKSYLYYLSCLIADTLYCDMCVEISDMSDSELETLDKITTQSFNNYTTYNILDHDNIGFITVPDRVNELLHDLKVLNTYI